ncbi:MAG: heme biosynthesis protein HemY, partial [Pseudomonadota bacterium]
PQWVCNNCHNIEPVWAPICSNCNGFDTLEWTTASSAEIASPTGAENLPLLVGAGAGTGTNGSAAPDSTAGAAPADDLIEATAAPSGSTEPAQSDSAAKP